MYLTTLALQLKAEILTAPQETWGQREGSEKPLTLYPGPDSIPCYVALDPFSQNSYSPGLFVIPGYRTLKADSIERRRGPIRRNKIHYITLALSMKLELPPTDEEKYDAAPMVEWSSILDLKDELDDYVLSKPTDLLSKIIEFESTPLDEVVLDASRYILVTSVFGFESC